MEQHHRPYPSGDHQTLFACIKSKLCCSIVMAYDRPCLTHNPTWTMDHGPNLSACPDVHGLVARLLVSASFWVCHGRIIILPLPSMTGRPTAISCNRTHMHPRLDCVLDPALVPRALSSNHLPGRVNMAYLRPQRPSHGPERHLTFRYRSLVRALGCLDLRS